MIGRIERGAARMKRRFGGEVLALCAVIFLADMLAGIVLSSFSVYARSSGVSLATLGALNTGAGLVGLAAALPLGMLSDRVGRTRLILAGLLAFTLAMVCLAAAQGVALLATARVLFALASIAVFQIGTAHLGDLTTPEQRPVAFGLLTTAMGLGFAVGPLAGGQLADRYGFATAYLVGAAVGVGGLLLAARTLRSRLPNAGLRPTQPSTAARGAVRQILGQPQLLLVTFGNMLVSLTFAGAVTTFFPLYARELLLTQAAVGTMFAVRAVVSTVGRFPNSALARRFGGQAVMLGAVFSNVVAMFGMAATSSPALLTALLALEGLAFGAYLVAGQTYIADHTAVENRGTAIGVYATAAGVGGALAPLILGLVADRWGLRTVFVVTGWTLLAGFAICLAGTAALRRTGEPSRHAAS